MQLDKGGKIMTVNLFVMLLAIYSVATGLVVEAIKKLLDEAKKNYAANLLAFIVAIVIGVIGTLTYYQLYSIPFSTNNIICAILLGCMSGVGAMVGFDKVKQLVGQLDKIGDTSV